MPPRLEARGLAKTYRAGRVAVAAVSDVSLTLERGELALLIGPSGSGKSTLMALLGCILTPSAGSVLIDGVATAGVGARHLAALRRARFGFVFQQFHLFACLSAAANVALALELRGVPAAERRARAADLLEAVGLARRAGFHPAELSGGEQQRVAIARALAGDPAIVLADEPTASLDQAAGAGVLGLLRDAAHAGRAVLVASHDPEVLRYADRVLRLVDGRLVDATRDALSARRA